MRSLSLLPLSLSALLLAGCAAEPAKPSSDRSAGTGAGKAEPSPRDLTLQSSPSPAVEVASAVELSRPVREPSRAPRPKISPRPAPAPAPEPPPEATPMSESVEPVPAVAVAEVRAEPAPVADASVGAGRELPPGRTVTVIPASAGPSSAPVEDDSWLPSQPARGVIVRGGDTCRPRGGVRGIGIAGRIPVGIRIRSLR